MTGAIELFNNIGEGIRGEELLILAIDLQGSTSILDTAMVVELNRCAQQRVCQVGEFDAALMTKAEESDGVNDLIGRYVQVDDLEVLLQAVPDKDSTSIDEVSQLDVAIL